MSQAIRQILLGIALDFWLSNRIREVYWFKKQEYCGDRYTHGKTIRITIEYVDNGDECPLHKEEKMVVPE